MNPNRFGLRDLLRSLSERSEGPWTRGAVHHGARILLLLGLATIVFTLFPVAPVPDLPVLERGMVAEEDIIAEVGFPIHKSEAVLAAERAEAAAGVAPIFQYEPGAVDTMLARVDAFLRRVESAAGAEVSADSAGAARDRLRRLLEAYGFAVTDNALDILRTQRRRRALAESLRDAVRQELPLGIVQTADLEQTVTSQVRLRRNGVEQFVPRDSMLTAPSFFERARRHLPSTAGADLVELQRLILIRFFEPSVTFDAPATAAARDRARQAVPTVKGEVLKGERIVGAHEQIGEEEIERLRAYQDHLEQLGAAGPGPGGGLRSAGAFVFNLLILSIAGLLLYLYRPAIYGDFRHLLVITVLILALVVTSAVIGRTDAPVELVPIAFPALVVAVLWDGRLALDLSLVLAVLLAGQPQFPGSTILFTTVLAGSATALSVRVVRRRAQTWSFIAIIALAYVAAAVTLGLLRAQPFLAIVESGAWGTANAVVSALIAMGTLPLFEGFARITTDQRLLELSDLDHPLLQRLRREAPGTFAHSINVANLAEAAAQTVDANPLLARVGVYYHDIGKIPKPQYFVENQTPGRNPHDKLKPDTSAAIVRDHVQDGLDLAEEHNLPDAIKAFIAEHHGTQPISFFYDRAREDDGNGEPDPADFKYPGPRPQSKETAIAMLADSVESAARVLPEPTPERIKELVHRIVAGKMELDQLEETPLTLREIARIEGEFANVLSGMYHHRIDYPSQSDEAETPPAPVGSSQAPPAHG